MKIKIISMLALCASSVSVAQADVIADWTFENDSIAVNNNPVADSGTQASTSVASAIGMTLEPTPNTGTNTDDVVLGKSSDTGANAEADKTNTWRVRAQGTTQLPANGWSSLAPIGSQGAEFAASTANYTSGSINISFDWYATTQGEANLQLRYTNDGVNWINTPITIGSNNPGLTALTNTSSVNTVNGAYISDNLLTNGSKAGQDWFQGLTATISDPLALNNANFAIEFVNASTGADNVSTQ